MMRMEREPARTTTGRRRVIDILNLKRRRLQVFGGLRSVPLVSHVPAFLLWEG